MPITKINRIIVLTIYDIFKAHDGTINVIAHSRPPQGKLLVENPEGGGACFVILLPVYVVKTV